MPGENKSRQEYVHELYTQYAPALLAYGCSLLANRAAAEDALHQVFLKLLSRGVALPAEPRPYLFRAMRNAALNHRRAEVRHVALEPLEHWMVAPGKQLEDGLTIQAALCALPDEQREIVVLRVWCGLAFDEVAGLVGASINTVASRYRYALGRLREVVAKESK
jgi:RNA polymerase sigma-70 factor (ECF subfamily)